MRAISILLSLPNITIKAIMVSDGSLPPNEGALKVKSLLNEFHADTIPVLCGNPLKGINPAWRSFNQQLNWGSATPQSGNYATLNQIIDIIQNSPEQLSLICLGSLTNVVQLIKTNSKITSNIEDIIWYNESINPLKGFNYECDTQSVQYVFNLGVRVDVISNLNKNEALFDTAMFAVCKQANTPLAKMLYKIHSQPAVFAKLEQQHFRLNDDLVALYIANPELFDITINPYKIKIRYNQDYNVLGVKEAMSDMIKCTYVNEQNVVFNSFPKQREMFNYDVRQIMDSALARYGNDEWKANVMTDEFHGHLGVFSIVGAKMGIKAREIFEVGSDMLIVSSYAGSKPPYSCMNDGIQVSTGATLGMGTIQLAMDSIVAPSAIFTYKNRSIRITLKKEYLEQVNADISEGIVKFGLMDDGYWKLIRRNALKYWVEWDRNQIFDISEIN
jgi:pyrimidine-specific ribonucleoside hydrolase